MNANEYNSVGLGIFQTPLGANNILPYLNKQDVLNMRKQEKEIKTIKKQVLGDRTTMISPKRGHKSNGMNQIKTKNHSPDSNERPITGIKEY
mmetsp:Transcript_11425/g.11436  ORF Transcript_11425/g.11436 Transcript_11425/m.11436 type:complete len:92 (+) Transcript_11425:467-742(+)